jgi:hypothetical protein
MFEQEKVTNQNVYIKIAGAKRPVSLFIKEWTAAASRMASFGALRYPW